MAQVECYNEQMNENDREKNRMIRRDKKRQKKNAPVLGGLPNGFPIAYWICKNSDAKGGTKK